MAAKDRTGTDITFAEMTIPAKIVPDCTALPAESCDNPVAVIRYNRLTISISGDISDGLLSRIYLLGISGAGIDADSQVEKPMRLQVKE